MRPTILPSIPLTHFLTTLVTSEIDTSKQIKLIICHSHATFIRTLLTELDPHHPLLQPTLNLLRSTPHIQLCFCDTVPVLLAYLATVEYDTNSIIYLIHPLRVHKHTSAFSAQGLSRTFASLYDTTARTGARVHVLEPADHAENAEDDPWVQSVPILGSGGKFAAQRGWVGRTVGIRRIVGRWCRFEKA